MLEPSRKFTARRSQSETRKTSTCPRPLHCPRPIRHGMATIYLDDCHRTLGLLPDQSVDIVIVDPPYGMTKCSWDSSPLNFVRLWPELNRVVKPAGTVIIFGLGSFSASVIMSNPQGFRYKLIWEKTQAVGSFNAGLQPMRAHEDIMIFCGETSTFNLDALARYPQESVGRAVRARPPMMPSLLLFKKDSQTCSLHSTQKPLLLLQLLIEVFSNKSDTVLDFTMGSASTGAAALLTGRHFIGIEMHPRYFYIASERLRYVARHGTEIPRGLAKVLKETTD